MKKKILSGAFMLIISFILSLLSEVLESKKAFFEDYPITTGVLYSMIFMMIGFAIEKVRNHIQFYERIKNVVASLKSERETHQISYKAIQSIMKSIVSEFKTTLDIKRVFKGLNLATMDEKTKLPCKTCGTDHITAKKGACANCDLPNSVWAGFTDSVIDKNK